MAKVRILPDRVANQIAAGEVIERPAAVVKELVENALDAGATRIEVEFRHGGRSLMRVEDNGHGMSRDDALLALERHATSKIVEATDLDRLLSYGFRGEALPSIASVSRFELQTREAGSDVGTEILVNGGKFVHVRECGRPVGTRIEVTHLFNSVPARRKFLKSDPTESAHIVQCVRLYALACPQTAFTLIEDGRVVFRSPECRTLNQRIAEIFGRQIAEALIAVEGAEPGLKLSGLIGRPGTGRATRHEMIVFVNARPVDSRTLNYALIESYHELLPKGRYPLAFVFFECDPAAVDVNVHPAKREVRFRSESQVRGFVIRAVLQRLRELHPPTGFATGVAPEGGNGSSGPLVPTGSGSIGTAPGGSNSPSPFSTRQPAEPGGGESAGGTSLAAAVAAAISADSRGPFAAPAQSPVPIGGAALHAGGRFDRVEPLHRSDFVGLRAAVPASLARPDSVTPLPLPAPPTDGRREEEGAGSGVGASSAPDAPAAVVTPRPPLAVAPAWRFVGLAHGNYALFETSAGLVLLDRRAAHERIWYERLRDEFRRGAVSSQRLLLPVPVELDAIAAALLLDRLAFLQRHGFEVAEFGRNFFRIEGVPAWMEPADAETFLRDLLGAFREGSVSEGDPEIARDELARLAAAKAVRLPETVGEGELRAVMAQLFATRSPLTSPGGRPTYIELNHSELARRFQR